MSKAEIKSLTKIKDAIYLHLYKEEIVFPNGESADWIFASRNPNKTDFEKSPDAVTIFCLSPDRQEILVTKEYRYPVAKYVTSAPAGIIENGLGIEGTARKELQEETGYDDIKQIKVLPASYSSVGMTDEMIVPVIVQLNSLNNVGQNLEAGEDISFEWLNKSEALTLALTGTDITAREQLGLLLFATDGFEKILESE